MIWVKSRFIHPDCPLACSLLFTIASNISPGRMFSSLSITRLYKSSGSTRSTDIRPSPYRYTSSPLRQPVDANSAIIIRAKIKWTKIGMPVRDDFYHRGNSCATCMGPIDLAFTLFFLTLVGAMTIASPKPLPYLSPREYFRPPRF